MPPKGLGHDFRRAARARRHPSWQPVGRPARFRGKGRPTRHSPRTIPHYGIWIWQLSRSGQTGQGRLLLLGK